ncbi:AI-2E family transporter [Sediminibacterium soli]|uniref:AI-2E family transporter n=1 Tax=Sediminibacterium soli TaxID=2698829 RepID=UPI00137AB8E3|nr:AI-2E family transporter [Sediminibacterium soli]NCI45911.1 AI-2E family transporter [Sediminibacterium soli]
MSATDRPLPFYAKLALVMLLLSLLCGIVYFLHGILFPLYFGLLLAFVLMPMISRLNRIGIPNIVSILVSLFLSIVIVVSIVYILVTQIASFAKDWPQLQRNFELYIVNINRWLVEHFHVKPDFLNQQVAGLSGQAGSLVTTTLFSITDILNNLVLIPLYTFLILYYRKLLMKFLLDLCEVDYTPRIFEVIEASKQVISSYIFGLLIEMIIVTCLNTLGLWFVGAKYVMLIAVMAAVLNLIPYIGMIIAGILGVLITMSYTQDISTPIGIIAVLVIVQILDNNFIFPAIVGGKVKLNSLFSVVAVLLGGLLGGISGMFLSIPTLAILKVTFDKIPHLKPWGMVLGDDIPVKYLSWKHMAKLWKKAPENVHIVIEAQQDAPSEKQSGQ